MEDKRPILYLRLVTCNHKVKKNRSVGQKDKSWKGQTSMETAFHC